MATGLVGRAYKEIFEDWLDAENLATSAADGVKWFITSDAGTAPTITATTDGNIMRGTGALTAADLQEVCYKDLAFNCSQGELYLETRFRLDVITTVAFNIGFNDDVLETSNTLPAELSGTTFTSNAATFAGIVFDTDATNDDIHLFWVDGDSDTSTPIADLRFKGMAPVAGEWLGVAIRLTDQGSGNHPVMTVTLVEESTGKQMEKSGIVTNLTRTTLLTPYFGMESRGTIAHQWDLDYIWVKQSRSTT